jgi:hypothetical protein
VAKVVKVANRPALSSAAAFASQAEQSKRFLEAALELGVEADDSTLAEGVRKMAQIKNKTFTGTGEASARKKLDDWKADNPTVTILYERKPIVAKKLAGSAGAPETVTISIDYHE